MINQFSFAMSWIEKREASERANLTILIDKYVPILIEGIKHKFKKITPLPEICHVEMLCKLLDHFLTKDNVPPDCPKEWYGYKSFLLLNKRNLFMFIKK